jgi:aminoglycoside 3-N-acetyltransferase
MESKESQLIGQTKQLVTFDNIVKDLITIGVCPGMTLLVHSSLSKLGWVCGGAAAVILALLEVLGPEGTLVMPTHSGDLSDPAKWKNPPVPEAWWPQIYESMPAYQQDLTPTRAMGAIPEGFRNMEGVLRSDHPQFSFAAFGPQAKTITSNHSLAHGMSENSPLARVYDLAGWVLLLGVNHSNNTSLHLAENRANFPGKKMTQNGAPVFVRGERKWVIFDEIDYTDNDFSQLGKDFARETGKEVEGLIGEAKSRLMLQRDLVDYAVGWMEKNRE